MEAASGNGDEGKDNVENPRRRPVADQRSLVRRPPRRSAHTSTTIVLVPFLHACPIDRRSDRAIQRPPITPARSRLGARRSQGASASPTGFPRLKPIRRPLPRDLSSRALPRPRAWVLGCKQSLTTEESAFLVSFSDRCTSPGAAFEGFERPLNILCRKKFKFEVHGRSAGRRARERHFPHLKPHFGVLEPRPWTVSLTAFRRITALMPSADGSNSKQIPRRIDHCDCASENDPSAVGTTLQTRLVLLSVPLTSSSTSNQIDT